MDEGFCQPSGYIGKVNLVPVTVFPDPEGKFISSWARDQDVMDPSHFANILIFYFHRALM